MLKTRWAPNVGSQSPKALTPNMGVKESEGRKRFVDENK
jgi:hypothetical protein